MAAIKRTIGVLGGMGPAATVDFLAKMIAATPALRDQDHVPVIVRNIPQIPDRSAAVMAGTNAPFPAMLAGLRALEAAGADVLAVPCNTAHRWYDDLSAGCRRPILHIADAVSRKIRSGRARRLGLMSTRGTIMARVYQDRLGEIGEGLIIPIEAHQSAIDAAIRAIKSGLDASSETEHAVDRLLEAGAQKIILACTELPLALAGSSLRDYCIDATLALAEDCVAASCVSPDTRWFSE